MGEAWGHRRIREDCQNCGEDRGNKEMMYKAFKLNISLFRSVVLVGIILHMRMLHCILRQHRGLVKVLRLIDCITREDGRHCGRDRWEPSEASWVQVAESWVL